MLPGTCRQRCDNSSSLSQILRRCEDGVNGVGVVSVAAYQGLYSRDMGNYEVEDTDVQFHSKLSDVSHQIQEIGATLELSYPSLYVDLPRQLSMPLRSQVSARSCFDHPQSDGGI